MRSATCPCFELSELDRYIQEQVQRHDRSRPGWRGSGSRWRRWCRCSGRRRADRVHGQAQGSRREEDSGHQGRARAHRSRPQGSEGSRRWRAADGEGRRDEGRSRHDEGEAGRAGCGCRGEVTITTEGPVSSPSAPTRDVNRNKIVRRSGAELVCACAQVNVCHKR